MKSTGIRGQVLHRKDKRGKTICQLLWWVLRKCIDLFLLQEYVRWMEKVQPWHNGSCFAAGSVRFLYQGPQELSVSIQKEVFLIMVLVHLCKHVLFLVFG